MSNLTRPPFTLCPPVSGMNGMIFVPTLISSGGGVPAYSAVNTWADYDIVDNRIFFDCLITLTGLGTLAAGNLTIGTLPYPATSQGNPTYVAAFACSWVNLAASNTILMLMAGTTVGQRSQITLTKSQATLNVSNLQTPISVGPLTVADLGATFSIQLSGTYQIF